MVSGSCPPDGSSTVGLPVVRADCGAPGRSPGSAASRQGPGLRCAARGADPRGEFGQCVFPQNASCRGPSGGRQWRDTDADAAPQRGVDTAAVVRGDRWDPLDLQKGSVAARLVDETHIGDVGTLLAESGADVGRGERPRQIARQSAVTGWHEPQDARLLGGGARSFSFLPRPAPTTARSPRDRPESVRAPVTPSPGTRADRETPTCLPRPGCRDLPDPFGGEKRTSTRNSSEETR